MRWSLGNVNKLRVKATQSEPLRDRTRRWQRQPECSRSAIASLPVDGRRRQSPSCTGPHLKQAFPVLWSGSFTHDARLVSTALDTKCGETEDCMLQWIPLARSWHLLARVGIVTIAVAAGTAAGRGRFPGRTLPALLCRGPGVSERIGPHGGPCCCGRNQHCLNALPRSCLLTETDPFDRPACNRDLRGSRRSKR